jgi:ABC-type branched-subunit amino acid transport system substrate-binding protein
MSRRLATALATGMLLVPGALGLAACGKSSSSSSSGGGSEQGGIKAGPGVTKSTITLGQLTDLSGVFAALGQALTQGQQAYWKQQNASGGVCNRQVRLITRDHGYDPQKAVTLYRDVEPKVAALQQLLGSPITAALLPTLERDSMYSGLAAWPPSLLKSKVIEITGATYDLEAINGIDWLMKNKGLKKGDAIGDIYFEGDYGEGGLIGVKAAAKDNGLKVVEQKIKATDTDMSGQISALKRANVKAIWLTVGPKQLASAAGVAKSVGLNVPLGGNGPVFSPLLLKTAVGKTLEKNLTTFGSTAPASLDKPAITKAVNAYKKYYPKGLPQASVIAGWSEAEVMNQVLTKACDNKDLSRAGIVNALHSIDNLDTGGLISGPMDFTNVGQPSTKSVYVDAADPNATGGQKALGGPYESDQAKSYTLGSS